MDPVMRLRLLVKTMIQKQVGSLEGILMRGIKAWRAEEI